MDLSVNEIMRKLNLRYFKRVIKSLLYGEEIFLPVPKRYPFGDIAIRDNSGRFFSGLDRLVEVLPESYCLLERKINNPYTGVYGYSYRIMDRETFGKQG